MLPYAEVNMDFFDVIESRRSVRSYKSDPVEEEKLVKILEAARIAPTACNLQPFRVLVIRNPGREAQLRKIYDKVWFATAPLVLLVCALPGSAWSRRDGKNYADVDAAIAMDHIVLAARALGLGSCWIGAFDPKAAREILNLEPSWEPLAFTPIGYPSEMPEARPRKSEGDIVVRR
jgi:nitroreductase